MAAFQSVPVKPGGGLEYDAMGKNCISMVPPLGETNTAETMTKWKGGLPRLRTLLDWVMLVGLVPREPSEEGPKLKSKEETEQWILITSPGRGRTASVR